MKGLQRVQFEGFWCIYIYIYRYVRILGERFGIKPNTTPSHSPVTPKWGFVKGSLELIWAFFFVGSVWLWVVWAL